MKSFKRLSLVFILSVFTVGMLNNCKDDDESTGNGPGENEVWMQDITFVPSTKTIAVGTTIKWTNKDIEDHDVTSLNSGPLQSGTLGKGATYSHQFNTPGTFDYTCLHHPGMNGKIIVQ